MHSVQKYFSSIEAFCACKHIYWCSLVALVLIMFNKKKGVNKFSIKIVSQNLLLVSLSQDILSCIVTPEQELSSHTSIFYTRLSFLGMTEKAILQAVKTKTKLTATKNWPILSPFSINFKLLLSALPIKYYLKDNSWLICKWMICWFYSSSRNPVDAHIIVKDGDQYALKHNDSKLTWEEVNVDYTVTTAHSYLKWCFIDIYEHIFSHRPGIKTEKGSSTLLCFSCPQVERSGDVMTPPLNLVVSFPHLSPLKNKLLDLTSFTTTPGVWAHTHTHIHSDLSSPKQTILLTSASHSSAGKL